MSAAVSSSGIRPILPTSIGSGDTLQQLSYIQRVYTCIRESFARIVEFIKSLCCFCNSGSATTATPVSQVGPLAQLQERVTRAVGEIIAADWDSAVNRLVNSNIDLTQVRGGLSLRLLSQNGPQREILLAESPQDLAAGAFRQALTERNTHHPFQAGDRILLTFVRVVPIGGDAYFIDVHNRKIGVVPGSINEQEHHVMAGANRVRTLNEVARYLFGATDLNALSQLRSGLILSIVHRGV